LLRFPFFLIAVYQRENNRLTTQNRLFEKFFYFSSKKSETCKRQGVIVVSQLDKFDIQVIKLWK